MTHTKITLFCLLLMACSLAFSCQKNENPHEMSFKNLIVSDTSGGRAGSNYTLFLYSGHSGDKCSGCIYYNGRFIHRDCQGAGNACVLSSSVMLQQVGTTITAMTTDTFGLTSEDFFYMPARSLFCPTIGPEHYLNIPAQVVYRDSAKLQFTFTGLFYSETPAYNNF